MIYLARCPFCVVVMSSCKFRKHITEVHQLSEVRYMCLKCPEIFDKFRAMKGHIRKVHENCVERYLYFFVFILFQVNS